MRIKWLTLASFGTLVVSAGYAKAQQEQPAVPIASPAESTAETLDRVKAQVLLHKANAALQENRFKEARRLAQDAALIDATYGLFDVRPEQVLAEIDRKEINAQNRLAPLNRERVKSIAAPVRPPIEKVAAKPTPAAPGDWDALPVPTVKAAAAPVKAAAAPLPSKKTVARELKQAGSARMQEAPLHAEHKPDAPAIRQAATTDHLLDPAPDVKPTKLMIRQTTVTNSRPADDGANASKIRAIQLMEQGLLALEEHRIDDAESLGKQALAMHLKWDAYDYRPENLLSDVELQRNAVNAPPSNPLETVSRSNVEPPESPAASNASLSVSEPVAAASPAMKPAPELPAVEPAHEPVQLPTPAPAATSPGPPLTRAPGALVARSAPNRAESLLEEAIRDLHDGHQEMARLRLERAERLLRNAQQPPAMAGASGTAVFGSIQRPLPGTHGFSDAYYQAAAPMAPGSLHPTANPSAGLRVADDAVMKPLHDPFLGDEPTSTHASSPGERRMIETNSQMAAAHTWTPPRIPGAPPQEGGIAQAAYENPSSTPAGGIGKSATPAANADGASRWTQSSPLQWTSQSQAKPATPLTDPSSAIYEHGRNPAPIAPPVTMDGSWSKAGRTSYPPPGSGPLVTPSTEQDEPGFFRRAWNAVTGQ